MSQRRAEVWETLFVLNREAWNWTKGGKKKSGKGSSDNVSKNEVGNRGQEIRGTKPEST